MKLWGHVSSNEKRLEMKHDVVKPSEESMFEETVTIESHISKVWRISKQVQEIEVLEWKILQGKTHGDLAGSVTLVDGDT